MKDPNNCTHTKPIAGHWEKQSQQHECIEYDDPDYFPDEWIDGYDKPTTIDINIHQYKCTQCGKIFGY